MNSFDRFSEINMQRANRWHHGDIREWSASDWAVATGGEMGELLNAIKKLRRLEIKVQGHDGDTPQPRDIQTAIAAVKKEIGDVYTYLDILTQFFGLRMWDCVRDTFNAISVREGMPERMPEDFEPTICEDTRRMEFIYQSAQTINTDRNFRVHSNVVTENCIEEILHNSKPDRRITNCPEEP